MGVPSEKFDDAIARMFEELDVLEAALEWTFDDPFQEDRAAWATLGLRAHLTYLKELRP